MNKASALISAVKPNKIMRKAMTTPCRKACSDVLLLMKTDLICFDLKKIWSLYERYNSELFV